ncbi:hypothetical protein FHT97_004544 [Rhizobium sp. BK399]|nr:hypothetical protein [Rhizobium sp. BK181]MBB3543783.1 hypothetical protein [Rhizobium sp. BK399]
MANMCSDESYARVSSSIPFNGGRAVADEDPCFYLLCIVSQRRVGSPAI